MSEIATSSRPSPLAANTAILLTVLAWGGQIPMMSALMVRWDPYWMGASRYICTLPFLLIALWLSSGPGRLIPVGLPWRKIWILGVFGIGGFGILFGLGIQSSGPVMSAVIMAFGPSIAALVARVIFKAPLPNGMWLAMSLGCGGAVLAMVDPAHLDRLELRGGEGLLILASTIWYWYSLQAPRWLPGVSNITLSAVTLITGAAGMIAAYPLLWLAGIAGPPSLPNSMTEVWMFAWVVVFGSVGGTFLWNYGVKGIGVVLASLFANLCPLVAIAIAAFLGAPATLWQVIGGALVIAGVVQLQLRQLHSPASSKN